MSFFRDCWESIRNLTRECMTAPLSRKKLLIFGGIFLALVVLVIILVVSLHGGDSGSDALNGPLTFGDVDSKWLKSVYKNQITKNVAAIQKSLEEKLKNKAKTGTVIWTVGASNCSGSSQKDAVSQTIESIDAAYRLAGVVNQLTMVTTENGLQQAQADSKLGMIIALDGGYTIDSRLAVLRSYYTLGARILTLTGGCSTPWAAKSGDSNPNNLTEFGKTVVEEANRLGIIVDLTGSSDAVIGAVMDMANKSAPILFNGVGAAHLTKNAVNLGNDTIRRLAGNKGNLVMVSFKCDRIQINTKDCNSTDIIEHINLISNLSSRANVGLAVDLGDNNSQYPSDLKNLTGVANLFDTLHSRFGWSMDDLKGLAYQNFLNLMSKAQSGLVTDVRDNLEDEKELAGANNLTCYSDLALRYGSST